MITDGAFRPDGTFVGLPFHDVARLTEAFRFITQPRVIDRILTHLRRTATQARRSRAPPRRWTSPRTTTSA